MRPRLPDILATGVSLVFIGNGSVEEMKRFDEKEGITKSGARMLTNPDLNAYRAAGMVRSFLATLGPAALIEIARAMAKGYVQTGIEGDRFQQGGTIVLTRTGDIVLNHPNRTIGGHPKPEAILEAARQAAA